MRCLLILIAVAVLAAGPFWESKPAEDWNSREVRSFLSASPWAQPLIADVRMANLARVNAYLATASIVRAAEHRRTALMKNPPSEGASILAADYQAYLAENGSKVVGLAIAAPDAAPDFEDARELKHLRRDSVLRNGGKTYKLLDYFAPTPSDPYLRLFFERPANPAGRLTFELYLPHVPGAFRRVDFEMSALARDGQPDY